MEGTCERIAAEVARVGWSLCPGFLGGDAVEALHAETLALHRAGAFHRAAVGPAEDELVVESIRHEEILWLAPPATPAQQTFFAAMETLRLAVNRATYLGLLDLEAHLAVFPVGGRYDRHVDRFEGRARRVLTCILYLNPDWTADDGGALRLYLEEDGGEKPLDVLPLGGTLVTFLSDRFPHEVLPARRPRVSLSGWFRRRPLDWAACTSGV